MRKYLILLTILIALFFTPMAVSAEQQYVGTVKASDVVTYINNFPIPSYNVNGYTFIVAEDLRNYGFDVIWNGYYKSICIERNKQKKEIFYDYKLHRPTKAELGKELFNMYKASNKAYIGNYAYEIECLAGYPGYTYINVDNLSVFGKVRYDKGDNAVKIDITDGPEWFPITIKVPRNLTIFHTCRDAPKYHDFTIGFQDEYNVCLSFFNLDDAGDFSSYACCDGYLEVEIIGEDGAMRYKGYHDFDYYDFSSMPYVFDYDNCEYSLVVQVPKSKMRDAKNGYGLLKVTYHCYCGSPNLSYEKYVNDLPY